MWAESRTRDRAKMQKLAELIKARRNITLAEKRKSRKNTLALVKQYAHEARAKRTQNTLTDIQIKKLDIPNADTPIPKELEPIPDSGLVTMNGPDYLYAEYYRIPNYSNKYHTENMLVIGRSKIPGAKLGLFAFFPVEQRNNPRNKHLWIKKKIGLLLNFFYLKGMNEI